MKNVTDTGRFSIGEKIFGVCFTIRVARAGQSDSLVRYFHPFLLKRLPLPFSKNCLETEVLTVSEHHKVSRRHDTEGKKDCDGYVLSSASGITFKNQYPFADYGQLDDTANWVFSGVNDADNTVKKYIDVLMIMPDLYKAKSDNDNPDQEFYSGLYDELSTRFEEAFPGKCLETSPLTIYENGKDGVFSGYFSTAIVDKTQ